MQKSSFFVLLSVIVIAWLGFLDQTILPVALPTIQLEFGSSEVELQWMINVYFLALAVFVLPFGRLSDILGKRFIYSWGIFIFTLGSLFVGISSGSITLILSRILQAIGSAMIIPPSIPILFEAFEETKHGVVMGLAVSGSSVAMVVGPFLGGLFTQYLSWRFCFLVNVPISILGLVAVLRFVPKSKKVSENFDFIGSTLLGLALIFFSVLIIRSKEVGLFSFQSWIVLLLGLLLLFFFFYWSKKVKHPLFTFDVFKNHFFSFSCMNIFGSAFILMLSIYWTIFMQDIFLLSPSMTGFCNMLASLPMFFMPIVAGKLSDHFGPKISWLLGFGILILSFVWIMFFLPLLNFWLVFPALFFITAAITSILSVSFSKGVSSQNVEKRSVANGLLSAIRQSAAFLGTATFGTIIFGAQHIFFFKDMSQHGVGLEHLSQMERDLLIGSGRGYVSREIVEIFNFSYEKAFFLAHFVAFIISIFLFLVVLKSKKNLLQDFKSK